LTAHASHGLESSSLVPMPAKARIRMLSTPASKLGGGGNIVHGRGMLQFEAPSKECGAMQTPTRRGATSSKHQAQMRDSLSSLALVAAAIAAGTFLFIYFWGAGRGIRTGSTLTVPVIGSILQDIDVWNHDDVERYGPLPIAETNSVILNQKLATLFKGCSDSAIISGQFVAADGLFHDAWGTPLLFMATNDPDFRKLNPELHGHPRFVAVWSAGRNKTNESGFGDDVFSGR
jgi:hypothetical protein